MRQHTRSGLEDLHEADCVGRRSSRSRHHLALPQKRLPSRFRCQRSSRARPVSSAIAISLNARPLARSPGEEKFDAASDHLRSRPSENLLGACVPVGYDAVAIGGNDRELGDALIICRSWAGLCRGWSRLIHRHPGSASRSLATIDLARPLLRPVPTFKQERKEQPPMIALGSAGHMPVAEGLCMSASASWHRKADYPLSTLPTDQRRGSGRSKAAFRFQSSTDVRSPSPDARKPPFGCKACIRPYVEDE